MLECHACLTRCMRALLPSASHVPDAFRNPRLITAARLSSRSFQTETVPSSARTDNPPLQNIRLVHQEDRPPRLVARQDDDGHVSSPRQKWSEAVGEPQRKSFRDIEGARRVPRGGRGFGDVDRNTRSVVRQQDNDAHSLPPTRSETFRRKQETDRLPHEKNNFSGRVLKESNLLSELKYLKDPLKLSNHVRHVLDSNDEEKALALCRMSSKALANTVSWNYLIDWQMKQGKTNAAMTTYNEMKKRAQKPDSHTYVILLRGLANYAHFGNALGKALSIYHSMKAPNAGCGPNIIHVNAVLKVCARANDMESLWDIASSLPERGPQSANSWTFTTILNYLRRNVLIDIEKDPGSEISLRRIEDTVVKGKQLWSVILARWREGELMIDEEVVCSMGRLLLTGNRPRDWDNVFSLIEQTMNITRLEPRIGTLARQKSGAPAIRAPHTPQDLKDDPREITLKVDEQSEDGMFDPMHVKPLQYGARKSPTLPGRGLYAFAKPGNSSLSLVLEACLKTILKHTATAYWDLFTDPNGYAIIPDLNNVHMLLRSLRRTGASKEAMQLVEDLPRLNLPPTGQTFWLAMTACQKDMKNPDAVEHGRRLLDCMQRTLAVPNILTISIYLDLAMQGKNPDTMISAVQRIWPSVINLRSLLSYGDGEIPNTPVDAATYRREALHLFRSINGCFQYLLNPERNLELGSLRPTYLERNKSLEAFVKRHAKFSQTKSIGSRERVSERPANGDKDGSRRRVRPKAVSCG